MAFWSTVMPSRTVPYGKRLVPTLIDQIARTDPTRICYSFPKSGDLSEGFRDVDFQTFANAINKTAYFIQKEIGRSSIFETVMYMGLPDIRHYIVLVALMKTGHKVLFSSHRNSIAGHADLIQRTECNILLHTAGFPVSGLLERCRMETLVMPELDYLLDDTPCNDYPYCYSYDEAKHHPCMVVHTYGYTGPPRAVVWPHSALLTADSHSLVESLDGREAIWSSTLRRVRRSFCTLAIFSGAGFAIGISRPLFTDTVVVLGSAEICTADTFDQILEHGKIDAANCCPITLEEVATRPDIVAKLRRLKHLTYIGGQLSQSCGTLLSKYVDLYNIASTPEVPSLVQHTTDRSDWQYICLNPTHNGLSFKPLSPDTDLFELVLVKDPAQELFQSIFQIFPRLKEYPTSEVYSKHPTKPHHWKYEGQRDDMIIFLCGEVFNPIPCERLIATHAAIRHCCIICGDKERLAAIIELRHEAGFETSTEEGRTKALKGIWTCMEEVNRGVDPRWRLKKDMIIFSKSGKRFMGDTNGHLIRRVIKKLYEEEIEAVYRRR